jgi:hypothetical protein
LAVWYLYNTPSVTVDTANVTGYIFSSDGKPDIGSSVEAVAVSYNENPASNIVFFTDNSATVIVDVDGGWSLSLVPNRRYKFKFTSSTGVKTIIYKNVMGIGLVNFTSLTS